MITVRSELADAGRNASTVNHVRRIIRGAFGAHASSSALAWGWMSAKVESEGQLRFYDPAQLIQLKRQAHSPLDAAVFTLAAEAGPRLSEIRALKVRNVDFATTERYLHYAPDPDAAAKLSGLWQSDDPRGEPMGSLVPFRI